MSWRLWSLALTLALGILRGVMQSQLAGWAFVCENPSFETTRDLVALEHAAQVQFGHRQDLRTHHLVRQPSRGVVTAVAPLPDRGRMRPRTGLRAGPGRDRSGTAGLSFAATSTVIVDAVPTHQAGIANGMNVNSRNIGGSIGPASAGRGVRNNDTSCCAAGITSVAATVSSCAGLGGSRVVDYGGIPPRNDRGDHMVSEQLERPDPVLQVVQQGTHE
jgi:hypothetical protein